MNATQLLAHFDRLAEAPNAVPRLRRFILDLAVRGKLVAQDEEDEPAVELLKRIKAEKARLVEIGPVKASKSKPANEEGDSSLIPDSWRWTRLVDVGFISPRNTAPDDQLVSFVSMPLIAADYGSPNQHEVRPWREIKTGYTHFAEGDVGLAKITPCFENGKSTVFRGLTSRIGAGTTELHIVRPVLLSADYILIYLKSSQYISTGIPLMTGTAGQKRVSTEYFTQTPFPLPPLAEQHRIVAKVDELMALCDQLEAAQQERERRRDRLAAASLQRLNQPAADTTPEAQREHARFHLQNLPRLATRPEHVKAMRQNIRSLAICGRLLPQDFRDESAAEFLKQVAANRDKLIKISEIREAKTLNSVDLEAVPFSSPNGWEWARFGELINHSDAGISPKTEGFARSGNHWGVLKVSAVSWDKFRPEENKQLLHGIVPPDFAHVRAGDFLISRANTRELVARCVIVNDKPLKLILSDKTVRLRLTSLGNPRFWCLVNNHADYARAYYAKEASGTSDSMKNVSRPIIYNLLMPIPPLDEQHRIVAKVDELMALCDQLEAQLTTTQTDSRRLLEAVLEAALAPA